MTAPGFTLPQHECARALHETGGYCTCGGLPKQYMYPLPQFPPSPAPVEIDQNKLQSYIPVNRSITETCDEAIRLLDNLRKRWGGEQPPRELDADDLLITKIKTRIRLKANDAKQQLQLILTASGPIIAPASIQAIQDRLQEVDQCLSRILELNSELKTKE